MVGLPCSGKTTRARQLEKELPAVRFTPDDWHVRLFGDDLEHPEHDLRHEVIEGLLWNLAKNLLSQSVSVILDFGFWSREEREKFRGDAAQLGAKTVVHYDHVSNDELFARLHARNNHRPSGSFTISPSTLLAYMKLFEPPSPEELNNQSPD